ncbi:hypothetical protein FB451DRAFT_1398028 [Mycena latifolia]|nr:hypothetical protein FB451DRAFT_1398028 [Mycena latifolia]
MATLDAHGLGQHGHGHGHGHWGALPLPMTPPHTDAVEPRRIDWARPQLHHPAPSAPAAQYHPQSQTQYHQHQYQDHLHPHPTYAQPRHGQLLTPPDDTPSPPAPADPSPLPVASTSTAMQPAPADEEVPLAAADADDAEPLAWAHDWLHVSRARPESAALVAEKTCEMICYLWFAPPPSNENATAASTSSYETGGERERLQLTASPTFVAFTRKLLETTQVSQSVIVLALHYIHRLRARNAGTPAQPGSEFRVAVAGLMMANKFLDDNTYTNATWAAVSLIPLPQINTMEREFLAGVSYNLYVSKGVYEDWGRLLRGLVAVRRERGLRRRAGHLYREPHGGHAHVHATPRRNTAAAAARRRRSVSPRRRWSPPRVAPLSFARDEDVDMADAGRDGEWRQREDEEERERDERAGSKRRAAAAFSPGSYHPRPHPHAHHPHSFAAAFASPTPTPTPTSYAAPPTATPATYAAPPTATPYTRPEYPHHNGQQQRPTLVIPHFASSSSSHSTSHGGSATAPASAYPSTSSGSSSNSNSNSYSSGSGSGSYLHPHASSSSAAYGSGSLATPLERFGALSLSGSANTPATSPRRERRERPVSFAGLPSSTSTNAGYQYTPYAERDRQAERERERQQDMERERERERDRRERERERGRPGLQSGGGQGGRSASSYELYTHASPSPFARASTFGGQAGQAQAFAYVPPAPSTVVQYPPSSLAGAHHSGQTHAQPQQQSHQQQESIHQQSQSQQEETTTAAGVTYRTPGAGTLTARWDYSGCAPAQAQDLYFYALACSPLSSTSSCSTSSGSVSGSSDVYSDEEAFSDEEGASSDYADGEGYREGEGYADGGEEERWEGGEEGVSDEEDDGYGRSPAYPLPRSSTSSSHLQSSQEHHPAPSYARDFEGADPAPPRRPPTLDARASEKERAREAEAEARREEARRARLRCAPAPAPAPALPAMYVPAHTYAPPAPSLPAFAQSPHYGNGGSSSGAARWGVQSARTSPARRSLAHGDAEEEGGGWTPPRVALPRFADLERWSSGVQGAGYPSSQQQGAGQQVHVMPTQSYGQHGQQQTTQPTQRATHPRRAVFANAGPPGVSGYAYAY